MTELLERVIAQLKTLDATEQDTIAALILEELEDEAKWEISFAKRMSEKGVTESRYELGGNRNFPKLEIMD